MMLNPITQQLAIITVAVAALVMLVTMWMVVRPRVCYEILEPWSQDTPKRFDTFEEAHYHMQHVLSEEFNVGRGTLVRVYEHGAACYLFTKVGVYVHIIKIEKPRC